MHHRPREPGAEAAPLGPAATAVAGPSLPAVVGAPALARALSRMDGSYRSAVVRGLQRSVGNASLGGLLQRQDDDAAPAFGDPAPVPLEGGAGECPAGVVETFQQPAEVPISVTADSPSQWITEVAAKLVEGVGHVTADPKPRWCLAGDGKSVTGASVTMSITKKVARPVRGHGLSGTANDAKWQVVLNMAQSINDHENKHAEIYKTAMKGVAQKMKDLKPAVGKKLSDADVLKVFDDAWCGAQKKQEELDAAEGSMTVNPDELGFKIGGAKHDYTSNCRSTLSP